MKKLSLILGLAEFCLTGIAQEKITLENVLEDISKTRVFELKKHSSYATSNQDIIIRDNTLHLIVPFDFDGNKIPEVIAAFKVYKKGGAYFDLYLEEKANRVIIDNNNDKIMEFIYDDSNSDGYLESLYEDKDSDGIRETLSQDWNYDKDYEKKFIFNKETEKYEELKE